MPKEPDKLGIKFELLVDVCLKYLCNGKPYVGKDPTTNGEKDLTRNENRFLLMLDATILKKRVQRDNE